MVPGGLTIVTEGETPLAIAVLYEGRDVFDYLLSLHPDLDDGGRVRCPPVVQAACAKDAYYLEALLRHGANADARDCFGKSSSDYATEFGRTDLLDVIRSHRE